MPDSATPLPAIVSAMLSPSFYPHKVKRVEMLQTHISWIFLTGEFAYKLKKPVNFGFLDFSSIDKRHHFCELELQLNRRLAPSLYLEVLPIGFGLGAYTLGSAQQPADWCLKMRQFEQEALFDHQLDSGQFVPEWMDELASTLADFHRHAEHADANLAYGTPQLLTGHIEANLQSIADAVDADELTELHEAYHNTIRQHVALFEERKESKIRGCHGDLHLRNIALIDGHPCIFDCIEFSDEYRMIDVLNDVAFLVMDCTARKRPDLGFRFLSRWLEHSGDYAGLPLLPIFLSYRASVRSKVAHLLAGEDESIAMAQQIETRRYFTLARSFLQATFPRLIAIGGLSGSGKSHLALLACGKERAVIIRSDATRKRLAIQLPELPLYSKEMSEKTYATMFEAARETIEAGFTAILDATFIRREDREMVRQIGDELGVPPRMLWLDIPEAELRQRIAARTKADRDISDADLAVLDLQLSEYIRPDETDIEFLTDSNQWPKN